MGEQELKDIIEKHRKWLRSEAGGERANLSYANLIDANLADANLSRADLSRANLADANLIDANLADANLSYANLRDADLIRADLSDANLTRANFSYANLSYANLTRADLIRANLSCANLSRANFSYANLSRANLIDANLFDANLSRANLIDANLIDANLADANLSRANLSEIKADFFMRLEIAKAEAPALYDALMRGKINGSSYAGPCACFAGSIANARGEDASAGTELGNGLKCEPDSATEKWFLAIRKGDTPDNNQVSAITAGWILEWASGAGVVLPEYRIVSSLEFPAGFETQGEK